MDYFEFYQIPVSFRPSRSLVRKKYIEISRTSHPDFFVDKTGNEQAHSLDTSTLNTNAYQILTDGDKTIQYVLTLNGLIKEGEKYDLPGSFLAEMMDINEKLMDMEMDHDNHIYRETLSAVENIREQVDENLQSAISAYETSQDAGVLKDVKDAWYRKKYLLRIQSRLDSFAHR